MTHAASDRVAGLAPAPFGLIDNVTKTFGADRHGRGGFIALEPISYTIHAGELIAFLGPSGCGKTTLLRIVAGMTKPSSGRVEIRGKTVDGPYADFGFAFQTPNLLPWRSVTKNVLFPMEIQNRNDLAARQRAEALLEMVGLQGFAKSRPHQLSGGMKQRVALCRALIHDPSLLLMDEPFGALDELTRMEMQDLLLEVRRVKEMTALFVTHSIAEAIYLADEVLVFSRRPGHIVDRIRIDLPYPRTPDMRYSTAFTDYERRASAQLGVIHARPHDF
jgi:NitT/TauT family transport system ATP-binding protein